MQGSIAGTPAYMAPEQAANRANVDARADLYALGCVAFFLLTGRRPFEHDDPLQLLIMHGRDTPDLPSRVTRSPVPPALDAIVSGLMQKSPGARPQTAEALDALLAAVPVEPWTAARAAGWWEGEGRALLPGETATLRPAGSPSADVTWRFDVR